MVFEIAKACPESEERILECVVEKLCHLDVDIKTKVRKFQFSNTLKIEPLNAFVKDLSLRLPSEKEAKIGILFDLFLNYIKDRVKSMSEAR